MRADIVAGAVFPDYELTDHTGERRKLSDLQGPDPMILVLSRGFFVTFDEGLRCFYEDLRGLDFSRHSRRAVGADRIWHGRTWSA